MAKKAEITRKPRNGWGRANRIARRSVLAISLVVGVSILAAEPLEADAVRTGRLTPIAAERETPRELKRSNPGELVSVSAFSASQSDAARVLLAQELGGESQRAVGIRSIPATTEAGTAPPTPRSISAKIIVCAVPASARATFSARMNRDH